MVPNNSNSQKLSVLIVYCCPESGQFYPIDRSELPDFFADPEIAVSTSSENKGWARALAAEFKIWRCADQERLILRLSTYDLILIFPLSLNTLAKFALGIQDSFPTVILQSAAEAGIPILINQSFIPEPENHMNPHLIRVYRKHWQDLQSGTIAGFSLETLDENARKILRNKYAADHSISLESNREIITREDVISASEALAPIKVSARAIITDIAKEEAQARGVTIIIE